MTSAALALRLSFLLVAVGLAVTRAAAMEGAAGCAESGMGGGAVPSGDPTCYELVATLSRRMGLAAAAATVVIVLTIVGLSRTRATPAPR